ncbi:hypothetical protein [Frankia nepalensis]|nr:hypothetical protein [Frankia nepalensis]
MPDVVEELGVAEETGVVKEVGGVGGETAPIGAKRLRGKGFYLVI